VLNVKSKAVSEILVTLLLMSILAPAFNIQSVEAETTPLINPVPGQYANYTMYFQNGTAYGWCLVTYHSYETPILVNVSTEDIYGEFWWLVNVMNRIMFEGTNVTWSFWIETDIKIDNEIILEAYLAKVVDSGIIDVAGFTREYWILESSHPSENITWLYGFDKETGILLYLKSLFPEGETNFMLTSTNIFTTTRASAPSEESFNFQRQVLGDTSSLYLLIVDINENTGEVNINGGDTQEPTIPFTWDWGDDTTTTGWMNQIHVYEDLTQNYIVNVTSNYGGGETDSAEILVLFTSPDISSITLPPEIIVTIPDYFPYLESRLYNIPDGLTSFNDVFFNIINKSIIEYVLSVTALIQKDFVNDDVYLVDGAFRQVVLRDASFSGMYSLWYTSPVSFAAGDYGFEGSLQWSSFFHEMGHNFVLNSPSNYYYGGKIDGSANAIFSESMALIFQHATAYELLNNAEQYGIDDNLAFDVGNSATQSIQLVREAYERYIDMGSNYQSWNDYATPEDETFDTFMVLAYKFFEHAELSGQGYRTPVKRMMELLQTFDTDLRDMYSPRDDTTSGARFRSTLLVSALSYAFDVDLRGEFHELNFPIDDEIYDSLLGRVLQSEPEPEPDLEPIPPPLPPLPPIISNLAITPAEIESGNDVTIGLDIENIDSQSFTYIVTMQIGELTLLIDVELGAYESKTVSRTIAHDIPGDYIVTVDGLTGSFTVKTPPMPAEFEFSNLRIFYPGVNPPEVEKGQTVTVTVSIEAENVGKLEGGRTVELKVDEDVVDSKEVTLGGGASDTVLFELARGEGTYEVEVEGFTESFTVNPKPSLWDEIPGFPYDSIIIGLIVVIIILWRLRKF